MYALLQVCPSPDGCRAWVLNVLTCVSWVIDYGSTFFVACMTHVFILVHWIFANARPWFHGKSL